MPPVSETLLTTAINAIAEAAGDAALAAETAGRADARAVAVEARTLAVEARVARLEGELAAAQRSPAVVVAQAVAAAICRIPGWQAGIVAILVALTGAAAIVPSSLPLIVGALHDLSPSSPHVPAVGP